MWRSLPGHRMPSAGRWNLPRALDGETIELPYALEAEVMEAGEHTLTLTAVDQAGNTAEKTVTFIIPEENASADVDQPEDTVHGNPTLSVNVVDPTEDTMTVTFKKGEKYQLGDENITGSQERQRCVRHRSPGSFQRNPGTDSPIRSLM